MTAEAIPQRGRRALFVATIFGGSFLLFLVQPMVARMALPRLGGAPAVWNSAMLVYQALLLGGYAYAHMLGRMAPRRQAVVHLVVLVLGALWLPIGLRATQLPADASPAFWVPWLLVTSIGPLFFAVSAQAPLIQRWFALGSGGRDPYALYAASNLGSFGGLIAYPLLVEPLMAVRVQSWLWTAGYALVAALVAGCALLLPRTAHAAAVERASAPAAPRRVMRWIALAAVPSGLMLATSTYLTTDIVAMPLLWVIPLGLYLLSFSIAFADDQSVADFITRVAPVTILLFGGIMIGGYQERPYFNAAIALLLLFMAATALHTALYRNRPEPDRLTGFYLAMSTGGVIGGIFAGLLAPLLFDWTYEYPLLIFAAGLLVPQTYLTGWVRDAWWGSSRRWALVGVVAAIVLLFALRFFGPASVFGEEHQGLLFLIVAAVGLTSIGARLPYALLLASALMLFGGYRAIALSLQGDARTRSYFGVYTIRGDATRRELDHGTTVHGVQLKGSVAAERTPTTYYAPDSGVGRAMRRLPAIAGPGARVGVVGLGTGTLACYAQAGQSWRFYEIDPAVVLIARHSGDFTYLSRCLPNPIIRIGDARLRLAQEATASLDLLALDAFSSDAVPMHLMTREAFAIYARVLDRRGLLLVHISNRFLDLEPVVAAAAAAGGWQARRLNYMPSPLDGGEATPSLWIAMSRDPASMAMLTRADPDWEPLHERTGFTGWTDDYSTILPLIKRF
ncbi:MAG TPA: hypothetical protein VFQ57_06045 [Sphingomonas sp.]|nr:hypothetical protein [Sphingomonas sp.]